MQLGYPPSRIDLITTPDGIDFQICYNSKMEVNLNEIPVNFIDLDNLKKKISIWQIARLSRFRKLK